MDNTIHNGTRDRHKEKPQEQNSSMLSNDQFLRARNVCASLTYINVYMNINGKGEIIDCAIKLLIKFPKLTPLLQEGRK